MNNSQTPQQSAREIVDETFKGLDDLIEDLDLRLWYKDLIITCMEQYAITQREQDWISAEDELPEENKVVILLAKDGLVGCGKYMWREGRHPNYYQFGNAECRVSFITHWRLLPEPPTSNKH